MRLFPNVWSCVRPRLFAVGIRVFDRLFVVGRQFDLSLCLVDGSVVGRKFVNLLKCLIAVFFRCCWFSLSISFSCLGICKSVVWHLVVSSTISKYPLVCSVFALCCWSRV